MRGRNNGGNTSNNSNRKGPNPLTRNYESNGPDVKIRGSAQQIAEKYATLARDAMSSGDRVMAENYLQHAEHYNRIIAAAQAQMPIQNVQPVRDEFDEDEDRDEIEVAGSASETHQHQNAPAAGNGSGPQPEIEGVPAEVALTAETVAETRNPREGGRGRERAGGQRGERRPREPRLKDSEAAEAPVKAGAEAVAAPAAKAQAEVAPPADAGPAALAAAAEKAEKKEAGAEAEEAPAKPRRPRKPRVTAASKEAADAAPAEEPAVAVSEG